MPIVSAEIQAQSYRYLRAVIIGLLAALAAAVFYQGSRQGFFLSSVSAYYYTPAQAIFVGALIGLGVSMIALQGMTGAEDMLLNLGGICAIVVAVVPTGRGADFQAAVKACQESGGALLTHRAGSLDCPTMQALQAATKANVQNNVIALLVAGGLALILSGIILRRDRAAGSRVPGYGWALAGFLVAGAVWVCGLVALVVSVDWLAGHGHYIAALGLLLAIFLVVTLNAHRRREMPTVKGALRSPLDYRYTWVAAVMVAGSGVLIALWLAGVASLFLVEIVVAFLFILFWTVQTIELEGRT